MGTSVSVSQMRNQKKPIARKWFKRGVISILFLMTGFGASSSELASNDRLEGFEHLALITHANLESAYFQRANVQLIAPEVQQEIQNLADQICLAIGTDRHFKVFLENDRFLTTRSMANGDIFITAGYLDMIEDRDELAFGLAREIGMQVKDLTLKEMSHDLRVKRAKNNINTAFAITIGSAIGVIYGKYALSPINNAIYKNVSTPQLVGIKTVAGNTPVTAQRGPGNLITASPSSGPGLQPIYGPDFNAVSTAQQGTSLISSFMNWAPELLTEKLMKITTHLVEGAYQEVDPEHRKLKNKLGLEYMQMAGYNGASGQKVIKKIEDFWAYSAASTNATPNNEPK